MIYFKLFAALAIIGSLYGNYYLIGKVAVKDAVIARQVLEVEGYTVALGIVSDKYQIADEVQSDEIKKVSRADFDKMAERHPDMLIRRVNSATAGMLDDLERLTRPPSPAKATTSDDASG